MRRMKQKRSKLMPSECLSKISGNGSPLYLMTMRSTGFAFTWHLPAFGRKMCWFTAGFYLINLGNADQERFQKSFDSFLAEAKTVDRLGLKLFNFHPGAHVNLSTPKEAISRIAGAVNRAAEETESVVFVLETMAGQGTVIGSRFEELAEILSQLKDPTRAGVCIDTCHIFSAGYDLRTEEEFEKTMEEFDRLIGFSFLKGMHLNDSKNPLNSRCDRHESLGKGHLGLFPFEKIASDKRFDNIPLILETPNREIWKDEIRFLHDKAAAEK